MISPETVEQVRERTDIVAIVQEAVPSLKKKGRSFLGLCPFHREKSPSFNVNADRGFFHCFGCNESGDVIGFVMRHDGLTFPEAVRMLAERAGIEIDESRTATPEHQRQKQHRDELLAAMSVAAGYYERQLVEHPDARCARDELTRRGLDAQTSEATARTLQAFRVGYAPGGWDGLATYLRAQGVSPSAAETVGLLVPRSSGTGHYDRFRHRLMFAVIDHQGRTVAFSGRALDELPGAPAREEKPPKYINSPESPIYTKGQALFGLFQGRHAIRERGAAVVVEGNFDVVSLHARGIEHVVAPLGTAFTIDQARLLKRYSSDVVFSFDSDAAGRKATRASAAPAKEAGLVARVVTLPAGKDPDELVRARGPEAFLSALESAKGMLEHLIDSELDATFSSANAAERVARFERVKALLVSERDPKMAMMAKSYAETIVARLDLHGLKLTRDDRFQLEPLRVFEQDLKRALALEAAARPPDGPRTARIERRPPGSAERQAIVAALIECPALLDDEEAREALSGLEGPSVAVVMALRKAYNPATKRLDVEMLLANVPDGFRSWVSGKLAAPQHSDEIHAKGHLLDHAKRLKRLLLSQEASELAREIHQGSGDWDTESELVRATAERLKTKHGIK